MAEKITPTYDELYELADNLYTHFQDMRKGGNGDSKSERTVVCHVGTFEDLNAENQQHWIEGLRWILRRWESVRKSKLRKEKYKSA